MKRQKKQLNDILEIIKKVNEIIKKKPSYEQMIKEVQMMNFKIKPITGNLTLFNLNYKKFLEFLWSLGKIEEFLFKERIDINQDKEEFLINLFKKIHFQYENELEKINLSEKAHEKKNNTLEIEIIKELKKKFN